MTIIIDGMDQNKTNVPHLVHNTKSTQNLWRLRTHLTGVLIHTQAQKGKYAYGYYDILQLPHDCNLTIHVLLEALCDLSAVTGVLPEVLYLQLDNSSRENKNKFMLSFCALLVQKKLFRKVRVILMQYGL